MEDGDFVDSSRKGVIGGGADALANLHLIQVSLVANQGCEQPRRATIDRNDASARTAENGIE
jgi:hypothetical protein